MHKSVRKNGKFVFHFLSMVACLTLTATSDLEAQCYDTEDQKLSNTYAYGTGNGNNSMTGDLPLTNLLGNTFEFQAVLSGGATWANGIELIDDPDLGDAIYMQPTNTGNSTSFATYTLSFYEPIENFTFISGGLNYSDEFTITASMDGTSIPIDASNFSNFNPSSGWNVSGNSVANPQNVGGTEIDANFFTTTIAGPLDQVTIVATKASNSNSTVTTGIYALSYCNFLLPIELAKFEAKNFDADAEIKWVTASESNNDYFELEHSTDGILYTQLTSIQGAGFSNVPISYQFRHKNIPGGDNFYRLKQIDFDGSHTYSEIAHIHRTSNSPIEVFPNPAVDYLYFSSAVGESNVQIFDIHGHLVRETSIQNNELEVSKLNSGMYLIRVGDEMQRIIKL